MCIYLRRRTWVAALGGVTARDTRAWAAVMRREASLLSLSPPPSEGGNSPSLLNSHSLPTPNALGTGVCLRGALGWRNGE